MYPNEPWFTRYKGSSISAYMAGTKDLDQNPSMDYLELDQRGALGPLEPMLHLAPDGVLRFTEAVLNTEPDERVWKMSHRTNRLYQSVVVRDPVSWFIARHGLLATSMGPRVVSDVVGPGLSSLAEFLPVASCPPAWADRLGLPAQREEIDAKHWEAALEMSLSSADELAVANYYASACEFIAPPDRDWCRVGANLENVVPGQVNVTNVAAERDGLLESSNPVLYVGSQVHADRLIELWGLSKPDVLIETHAEAVPSVDPQPLVDEFPALRAHLSRAQSDLLLVRCDELLRATIGPHGRTTSPATSFLKTGEFFGSTMVTPENCSRT